MTELNLSIFFFVLGLILGWWGYRWLVQPSPSLDQNINQNTLLEQIKELEEKLKNTESAYNMAHDMSLFKGGFLARIAHELRSPLSSLIGLHQLVLSDLCENPQEELEFIQQANQAALDLVRLLDQIIKVSKVQHGTKKLNLENCCLVDLLIELKLMLELQSANRGIKLEIIPPAPSIFIMVDHITFQQLMGYIIRSGLYIMNSGSIIIGCDQISDSLITIWVEINDNKKLWSDPIDLLNEKPVQQSKYELSPGMNLILAQTLLESMNVELKAFASPTDSTNPTTTRLEFSLPFTMMITDQGLYTMEV